jgi:putative photosynthetic complex assembly protein 2
MLVYILPILFAVLIWWSSTGLILYLNRLPRNTFPWTMGVFTVFLIFAVAYLHISKNELSVLSAYGAFFSAIIIWAWQEVAFLLGYITGSHRLVCPTEIKGRRKLFLAFYAVAYHELTLFALGIIVLAATWNGSNLTAVWIYFSLWIMRQSAKLNIFLGARNLSKNFLPEHLHYIGSYFSSKTMNALFPVSIVLGTYLTAISWQMAFAQSNTPFEIASHTFVAALLTLGMLEHWLMMLPVSPEPLWRWILRKPQRAAWKPAHIAK